ncbi:HdeD family acid-resistance protein [Sphaerisporangium sp. B11E5]|uniref:HdeD family acid-resistance protein n=1 Tax=Sphaerisporangium sp. B11E5 TaxID=3153563 RepID=UPI00325D82B7
MRVVAEETTRHWWSYAVRGVAAVLFGILAIVWPLMTLFTLVVLFGAFAVISGVITLVGTARGDHPGESRPWAIASGVLGIAAGVIAWLWPGITTFALLMLIAAYAVLIGGAEIVAAFRRRRSGETEWMYVVYGALAVLFGILMFLWPASGALALTWLIGIFAIVYGAALLMLAYRIRDVRQKGAAGTAPHAV